MGASRVENALWGTSNIRTTDMTNPAGSSPMVITKGLVLTCGIDAFEGQKLAIVDIGTAFLHADNDEEILMKLRGKIVELLVQLEPTMYLLFYANVA